MRNAYRGYEPAIQFPQIATHSRDCFAQAECGPLWR